MRDMLAPRKERILIMVVLAVICVARRVPSYQIQNQMMHKSVRQPKQLLSHTGDKQGQAASTNENSPGSCPRSCKCSHEGRDVDCSSAELTKFPDTQALPSTMKTLKINNNRIVDICPQLNKSALDSDPFHSGFDRLFAGYNAASAACLSLLPAKIVDLSYNKLSHLKWTGPVQMKVPSLITALYLNNNAFSRIPDILLDSHLMNLQRLDMSSNHLQNATIPANFGPFPHLQKLLLQRNGFVRLDPNGFMHLNVTSLQNLNLLGNKITHIAKDAFTPLKSIGKLILSNNKFTWEKLPASLGALQGIHLQQLSLQSNKLTNQSTGINTPFAALHSSQLATLDLSQNRFTTLSATLFAGLPDLRKLNVAQNRLKNIEANAFRAQKNLTFLNLSENKLTFIKESWFKGPVKSKLVISLARNPFRCDCKLLRVFPTMMKHGYRFYQFDAPSYWCHKPKSATGFSVAEFLKHCGGQPRLKVFPFWIIAVVSAAVSLCVLFLILFLKVKCFARPHRQYEPIPSTPSEQHRGLLDGTINDSGRHTSPALYW